MSHKHITPGDLVCGFVINDGVGRVHVTHGRYTRFGLVVSVGAPQAKDAVHTRCENRITVLVSWPHTRLVQTCDCELAVLP